ncbi:MAG TPA: hypothetical protein V6C52_09545 [Coleofasciculaceae cyanobacterium]
MKDNFTLLYGKGIIGKLGKAITMAKEKHHVNPKNISFWKRLSASEWIALFSCILSLSSFWFTYSITNLKEINDRHIELQHVIQHLTEIHREIALPRARMSPGMTKFTLDEYELELEVFIMKAYKLIKEIPKEKLSPSEIFYVGSNLAERGIEHIDKAEEMYILGQDIASRDPYYFQQYAEISVSLAKLFYEKGDIEKGKELFEKTLNNISNTAVINSPRRMLMQGTVYMYWASAETETERPNCQNVIFYLNQAEKMLDSINKRSYLLLVNLYKANLKQIGLESDCQ